MSFSFILPFAIRDGDRGVVDNDVEVASVLLLAEAQRKKFSFLGHAEKLAYLSKIHYPFWLIPWRGGCIMLDGLASVSSSIIYREPPNLEAFIEDFERGGLDRGIFKGALERHEKTFLNFEKNVEFKFNALISEDELLTSMVNYIREASINPSGGSLKVALIPLRVDLKAATEAASRLSSLYNMVSSDILGLDYARKLLVEMLRFHEQMINKELNFIRLTYGERLSRLKRLVEERVKKIQEEWNSEVNGARKTFEGEVKAWKRELERGDKELQRLESKRAGLKKQLEVIKEGGSATAKARLEHNIKVCDAKVRRLKNRIRKLVKFVEEARRRHEAEVEKINRKYQGLIEGEKASIARFEAEMNMEVKSRCAELESIRASVNSVIDKINGLIVEKERDKERIEALAIPWSVEEASLLCVPIYVAGYRVRGKVHLTIIPPLKVFSSPSLVKTLREKLLGFGLASKLKLYVQPRCRALARVLDLGVRAALASDETIRHTLKSITSSTNQLSSRNFKQLLADGIRKLEDAGWIGDKEAEILSSKYLG